MAKKSNNHRMNMTPIMGLSVFAIFALMIPMFAIAGNREATRANNSRAAYQPTPTPEAMDDLMMEK